MRRWLGRYVAVALLLVACVASLGCEQDTGGTPCGEPICFEPNVRVNDVVEGNQGLPSITVGPSGHAYVAWDDSHDNDDVYLASARPKTLRP